MCIDVAVAVAVAWSVCVCLYVSLSVCLCLSVCLYVCLLYTLDELSGKGKGKEEYLYRAIYTMHST